MASYKDHSQLTTPRSGQYYSTINDLLRFGDAILKHELINATQTRKWLKPVVETSSAGQLVGLPWEIFRAKNLTTDGRLIEFYTKGGDIAAYHSTLALIPDYDIVATILISGNQTGGGDVLLLFSQLVETLLPALETAGKNEATPAYAGTYTDNDTNSTITLTLDDAPGFNISTFIVRDIDILQTYGGINLPPVVPPPPGVPPYRFRLYPTTITTDTEESWRASGTSLTAQDAADADAAFFWDMPWCVTWAQQDRIVNQLYAQDHFVFAMGEGGVATSVELVGYQVTLTRG